MIDKALKKVLRVNDDFLQSLLYDFGIRDAILSTEELLRYDYSDVQVRLIIKVLFSHRAPVVVKLKNEKDITREIVERQTAFAMMLFAQGVPVPRCYQNRDCYTAPYTVGGFDVLATAEDFCENEVKTVDCQTSEKTGRLLALTHNLSEKMDCHVPYHVLFDPFAENDLMFVDEFIKMADQLTGEDLLRHQRIMAAYQRHMDALEELKKEKTYAVQGDISDCNLFYTKNGELGMFDFNNCGENRLFSDAVMQAVFESRLMDYDKENPPAESELLSAFWRGYCALRPFTDAQKDMLPHLYAVIYAFWGMELFHNEDSLKNVLDAGDRAAVTKGLERIEKIIMGK